MWRIRRLIRYLDRYRAPNASPLASFGDNKVKQDDFTYVLAFEKRFLEDCRHFFVRWFYAGIRKEQLQSEFIQELNRKQYRNIKNVINNCLARDLIQSEKPSPYTTDSERYIWTNNKSREFLKPLKFVNALLKEYGYIISFLFGVGGTSIVIFWNEIISLLRAIIIMRFL